MAEPSHEQEIKSVRLSSSLLERLRSEAESKGISVNSLIVSILQAHEDWSKIDAELESVSVARASLIKFLDAIDDEKLVAMGKEFGSVTPKEVMMIKFKEINLDSLLSYLRFVDHQGFFAIDVTRDESKKIMFICATHRAGPKVSLFAESYFAATMHECLPNIRFETERSANLVRFKLFLG